MLVLATQGNSLTLAEGRGKSDLNTLLSATAHNLKVEHWMRTSSFNDPEGVFRKAPDLFDFAKAQDLQKEEQQSAGTKENEAVPNFEAFEPVQVVDKATAVNFATLPKVMPNGCQVPNSGAMAGLAQDLTKTPNNNDRSGHLAETVLQNRAPVQTVPLKAA